MNEAMKIIREVNVQAEACYEDAKRLGNHAAYALQGLNPSKKRNHRSQMTGLENIAESALKTSDIFDYIKKQTARFDYWRKGFPGNENPKAAFGECLKDYLETDLAQKRKTICSRVGIGEQTDVDKQKRQHVLLLLIRQFIRQMVVQYEYIVSLEDGAKNGTDD